MNEFNYLKLFTSHHKYALYLHHQLHKALCLLTSYCSYLMQPDVTSQSRMALS